MILNGYSIYPFLRLSVVFVVLVCANAQAGMPANTYPCLIEIFTTTKSHINGAAAINQYDIYREIRLHIYDLDEIQRINEKLSKGLTTDPELSKQVALQRLQQLQDIDRSQMQRSAIGISKAMRYGIGRYPAIVFDGQVVVYGEIDLQAAILRYQQWRTEGKL